MNKLIKCAAIFLCIGLITGCNDKKVEKELNKNISNDIELSEEGAAAVCTADFDYTKTNGFVTGSKFIIYTDNNNIVTKVVTQEIAESNDESVLEIFKDSVEENYSVANQYGGYTYNIQTKGNRLTITTTIDYSILDMEKMATDNEELKVYLNKDYKFTLTQLQAMYTVVGAECKTK